MPFSMRRLCLALFALAAVTASAARAQNVVREFSGTGQTTTAMFTVDDRWEVRWNARQAISVAAMSSNGTIVAGASGVLRGSLFVPTGGPYYLKITDGTVSPSAPATNPAPTSVAKAAPTPAPHTAPVSNTNAPPVFVPDVETPAASEVSWHLQVVQLGPTVAATETLTVYTPYFTVPDSVIAPSNPAPAPPPPTLTPEQFRSMVTIKGDNAQGNGFLVRSPDGVSVVCPLQLLAANPNLQIVSSTGAPIKILSAKSATDRDLALIAVQDDHLNCLPYPARDDNSAGPGDTVLIPVVGQVDAMDGIPGKIVDFGLGRVNFDNPVGPQSAGAPVIFPKNGEALAIVVAEKKPDLNLSIVKAWAGNPAPGSATIIPYYGLLLKDVAGWETLDLGRFADESSTIQDFHDTTRCLDSYLNGRRRRNSNPQFQSGPPDSQYYTKNARIQAAVDSYKKLAADADHEQTDDAARELVNDLQTVADSDMDQLQGMNFVYSYDRRRVQEELTYRKAIKAELDSLGDNLNRVNMLGQTR
jgi:hypothetical protein